MTHGSLHLPNFFLSQVGMQGRERTGGVGKTVTQSSGISATCMATGVGIDANQGRADRFHPIPSVPAAAL